MYDEAYFQNNHWKRLHSWYRVFVTLYYRYVARYAMITPAKIQKGDRVLDIGCGIGILVQQFHKLGYRAFGIDINKAALSNSLCRSYCSLVSKTAQLDYPNNYFDLIVSREVLEHIPVEEIDDCIKEWDRVGKGVMVHLIAVTEHGKSATDDPTHVNVQPKQWWIQKFESHGYEVIQKPRRLFFSPFGNKGYLMVRKKA